MRALIHLARRNVRRSWRSQLLVIVLIALPVGLGSLFAIAERSVYPGGTVAYAADYGATDQGVTFARGPQDVELDKVTAALRDAGGEVLVNRSRVAGPSYTNYTDVDLTSPLAEGLVRAMDGRTPTETGEVAISRELAERYRVGLGEQLPALFGGPAVVVGVAELQRSYERVVYLPPGSMSQPDDQIETQVAGGWRWHDAYQVSVGVRGLRAHEVDNVLQPFRSQGDLWIRSSDDFEGGGNNAAGIAAFVSAALLVEAALLAAAAYAIRGRRRVVEFARLSAVGADPKQIQTLVLLEAMVVALVGAVVGIAVAATVAAVRPQDLETVISIIYGDGESIAAVRWNPLDWFWPVVFAVMAALAAAWMPARTAARLSTTEALASGGRRTALSSLTIPLSFGLALIGFGLFAVAADPNVGDTIDTSAITIIVFLGVLSLVLCVAGLAAAAFVLLDSSLEDLLSVDLRLALRDAARHRLRSVMAICAVGLLLGVSIVGMTLASSASDGVAETVSEARLARFENNGFGWMDVSNPDSGPVSTAEAVERLGFGSTVAADRIGSAFDYSEVVVRPQDVGGAAFDDTSADGAIWMRSNLGQGRVMVVDDGVTSALELSPQLQALLAQQGALVYLRVDGLDGDGVVDPAHSVDPTPVVVDLISEPTPVTGVLVAEGDGGELDVVAEGPVPLDVEADAGREEGGAELDLWTVEIGREELAAQLAQTGIDFLVSAETAAAAELPVVDGDVFVIGDEVFGEDQRQLLLQAGSALPRALRPETSSSGIPQTVELIVLAVVVAFVLLVHRVLSALVAIDLEESVSTMLAIGAPSRLRQRQLAGHAFWQLLMAVVSAIPMGLAVAWIVHASGTYSNPFTVPWVLLGGLALVPLVGAAFVAATTRDGVATMSRRLT